ncbi:bleomycin hydrolase [Lycorma delicatula]|uniref:bleomycin hydrolase n=1 Tax=Lycorma delicatula TaxID=130591 RepID=UPI003F5129A7
MEGKVLSLSKETIGEFSEKFYQDPSNVIALNACARSDPIEVCISRTRANELEHVYTHKIDFEGKPVTNQKSTGRCWLFAALNVIRIPVMKQYNIDEFEFSQAYLFFWDKIERANFFLNTIVDTYRRGEEVEGRLVSLLLSDPIPDGGQWDMVLNLIRKYGLLPKKYFPDSHSAESSGHLNGILRSKLREFALVLRNLLSSGAGDEDVKKKITEQMCSIYRIVSICLCIPPKEFVWEYYDKNKQYQKHGPFTPLEFYNQLIRPHYNVNDKVALVSDPRPNNPYGKLYTIDCLGNMVGGCTIEYNNQPIEVLIAAAAESIKNNEAVWFGCEVAKRFASKLGYQDLKIHDYNAVFKEDVSISINKAERMIYGESQMSHAMVLTAVTIDEDLQAVKWRVENSWGDDRGDKGYFLMTTDWFKEYVYEIVVDKKFISQSVMDVFKQTPTVLPLWDPMGVLAD